MTTNAGPELLRELADAGTTGIGDYLRTLAAQWEADRAALERARALAGELEWCGVDNWLECPWCLGAKAEHYGEPAGHKPDCKLAAFLADASGGAA